MINPSFYKRVNVSPNNWVFNFDTLGDFNRFITEKKSSATGGSTLERNYTFVEVDTPIAERNSLDTWYGINNVSQLTTNMNSFLYERELPTLLSKLDQRIGKVYIKDLDQNKVIEFTEQEVGIFSFDLASLGLIPVYEYYSDLLKAIVDNNKVQSYKNAVGTLIYFLDEQVAIPLHKVNYSEKYGGWYSEILKRVVAKSELELIDLEYFYPEKSFIPRHDVEKRHKLDTNGKKKYTTTFKKSFIKITKKEKPMPRIDIIAPFSFNASVDAETMKYNALGAIKLAETLSKLGINFKIVITYPFIPQNISPRTNIFMFMNAKSEEEPLDKNRIAVLLSDPRYYRYERFRSIVSAINDVGVGISAESTAATTTAAQSTLATQAARFLNFNARNSNWSTITDTTEIKNNYVEYLKQSNKSSDREAASRTDTKFVLNVANSEQQAFNEYDRIIREIRLLLP